MPVVLELNLQHARGPSAAVDRLQSCWESADLPGLPLAQTSGIYCRADITGRLWMGAMEALRQLTYWRMKRRAGTVGESGLGPFLGGLASRAPDLRMHLVGHSFGARLVSFSLGSLLDGVPSLPHDRARSGALDGLMAWVNGSLLSCYSSHDTAIGLYYPVASMTANDDTAGVTDALIFRWGAIGVVDAILVMLQSAGTRYSFAPGGFTNIDSTDVVRSGAPPHGARSDIVHAELGGAMLSAAGLG